MQALRESVSNPEVPALVPARMLNEHAYCPRLAYLEWVQGDFTDNADTVEGRFHHRNVDAETGALPAPDEIAIDDVLRARTRELLAGLRASAACATPPPPLVDSPKCPRCSLVGICLPDEVNLLRAPDSAGPVRRLVPARDDALPLYVHS